jgi:hypothetical protein
MNKSAMRRCGPPKALRDLAEADAAELEQLYLAQQTVGEELQGSLAQYMQANPGASAALSGVFAFLLGVLARRARANPAQVVQELGNVGVPTEQASEMTRQLLLQPQSPEGQLLLEDVPRLRDRYNASEAAEKSRAAAQSASDRAEYLERLQQEFSAK